MTLAETTAERVCIRKKRSSHHWIAVAGILAALVASGGLALHLRWVNAAPQEIAGLQVTPLGRVGTGHQRAERLAFSPDGSHLAVTCPRYNRLMVYRVAGGLVPRADIVLEGRPVAVAAVSEGWIVLQRPAGDARHIEPGFWREYAVDGTPRGERVRVGWDPDDLVLSADGQRVMVLLSGNAEGETNRPAPSLVLMAREAQGLAHALAETSFSGPDDDPARLDVRWPGAEPGRVAVSLCGSDEIALAGFERDGFGEVERIGLSPGFSPGSLRFLDRRLVVSQLEGSESVAISLVAEALGPPLVTWPLGEHLPLASESTGSIPALAAILPAESALALCDNQGAILGRLPLRGPWGLAEVLPMSLAVNGSHVAVSDRSGGVHLVALGQQAAASDTDGSASQR